MTTWAWLDGRWTQKPNWVPSRYPDIWYWEQPIEPSQRVDEILWGKELLGKSILECVEGKGENHGVFEFNFKEREISTVQDLISYCDNVPQEFWKLFLQDLPRWKKNIAIILFLMRHSLFPRNLREKNQKFSRIQQKNHSESISNLWQKSLWDFEGEKIETIFWNHKSWDIKIQFLLECYMAGVKILE